uniref:Uncharacterized protein n=1 Tax=Aegilops tauschii subsp. strangulata TaxID=200361 RepID=A0A453A1D5_AEGTS
RILSLIACGSRHGCNLCVTAAYRPVRELLKKERLKEMAKVTYKRLFLKHLSIY